MSAARWAYPHSQDGAWIHPEDVLGPDRPGRRLCLLGDTCDSIGIAPHALGADVLVHESTFAAYKHGEAIFKGHSTSTMAGEFARMIKARNLLLTHFSNRYGTANTRNGGTDGSEGFAGGDARRAGGGDDQGEDDDVDDDMALPEEAPEDMKAAAQAEFSLVEGLVREASKAKGDSRVVAASDFFTFNVQRRECFDDIDRAKGKRDVVFDGPDVTPLREDVVEARRRIDSGIAGYHSPDDPPGSRGGGGYRGNRGGGWGASGASGGRGGGSGRGRGLRGRGGGGRGDRPSYGSGGGRGERSFSSSSSSSSSPYQQDAGYSYGGGNDDNGNGNASGPGGDRGGGRGRLQRREDGSYERVGGADVGGGSRGRYDRTGPRGGFGG